MALHDRHTCVPLRQLSQSRSGGADWNLTWQQGERAYNSADNSEKHLNRVRNIVICFPILPKAKVRCISILSIILESPHITGKRERQPLTPALISIHPAGRRDNPQRRSRTPGGRRWGQDGVHTSNSHNIKWEKSYRRVPLTVSLKGTAVLSSFRCILCLLIPWGQTPLNGRSWCFDIIF
jgi:hypothetical protein